MALASRPPKAPARVVDAKKKVYRFCASARLYLMKEWSDFRTQENRCWHKASLKKDASFGKMLTHHMEIK
jgi:hypothetical protein